MDPFNEKAHFRRGEAFFAERVWEQSKAAFQEVFSCYAHMTNCVILLLNDLYTNFTSIYDTKPRVPAIFVSPQCILLRHIR